MRHPLPPTFRSPLPAAALAATVTALAPAPAWPAPAAEPHKNLRVSEGAVRPLSTGWSTTSLLDWDGDGVMDLTSITGTEHRPDARLLYPGLPAGSASDFGPGRPLPESFPKPELAAFKAPDGRTLYLNRQGFQVLERGPGDTLKQLYRVGVDVPAWEKGQEEDDAVVTSRDLARAAVRVGDLNEDGVPDLLFSPRQTSTPYWPDGKKPWHRVEHRKMGHAPDRAVEGNFKGYGVLGEWLGDRYTQRIWWVPGAFDRAGELTMTAPRPVYSGAGGSPVFFRSHWHTAHVDDLVVGGQRHLLLVSSFNRIHAMPVRVDADGTARAGRAVPLLGGGADLGSISRKAIINTADLDGDGRDEVMVDVGAFGRRAVLSGDAVGAFTLSEPVTTAGGYVELDCLAVPSRIDWDGDGLEDVVIGDASGVVSLWPGTDDPLVYGAPRFFTVEGERFRRRAGETHNLQGPAEHAWVYANAATGDWDGDGRPDLVVNDNTARVAVYLRASEDPTELMEHDFVRDGLPLAAAWRSRPAVLAPGQLGGPADRASLLYLTPQNRLVRAAPLTPGGRELGEPEPLDVTLAKGDRLSGVAGHAGRVKFAAADWDGDGDTDVIMGTPAFVRAYFDPAVDKKVKQSAAYLFENVGTEASPQLAEPVAFTHADGTPIELHGHTFSAFPTDLDGDGELDLIAGDDEGRVVHFSRSELAWE